MKYISKILKKKIGDLFVHTGEIKKGKIKVGQSVNLEIDVKKRNNSKANHSATHLLHETLRRILGKHVTQKGSLVSPDRLRFDFSHNKPIADEEMSKINKVVNDIIKGSSEVQTRIMTPKEAVKMGALALFGEKYGEEVRVVFMGKENNKFFSTELCGGTHVKNTKEIGKFKVIKQSSIAAGVRRVEALRDKQLEDFENFEKGEKKEKSKEAFKKLKLIMVKLNELGEKPKLSEENINRGENLMPKIKILTEQLNSAKVKFILNNPEMNKIKDIKIKDFILRYQVLEGLDNKELRNVVDFGKREIKKGIILAFTIIEKKVGVAIGVTQDLTKKYDSVDLVKIASQSLGGKGGGGRKDFAQAGGIDKSKIEEALKAISKKIN